jgi:hypothetical protein
MFLQAIDTDDDAYLSLTGQVRSEAGSIVIAGPAGEVRVEGHLDELGVAHTLISDLNGSTPVRSLLSEDDQTQRQQRAILAAMHKVGALLDLAQAWRWFHELSSNPSAVPLAHDPMAAYDLPRLTAAELSCPVDITGLGRTPVDDLADTRRSAALHSAAIQPSSSLASAMRLAANAYLPQWDGRRPVASGGGLYPLHFWVIGTEDLSAPRQVLSVDHDLGKAAKSGEINLPDLHQIFVPDPDTARALDCGAAVIVIAADPHRIIRKYGNRGWRYTLIECGAVMHQIMLAAATSQKESVRPIGGYFDLLLHQAICAPALPLLTILVLAEQ